jgi:hypothetical protein
MAPTISAHETIVKAGWSYRNNDRGWVIYRNPKTGLWHTRYEAISIIETGRNNGTQQS